MRLSLIVTCFLTVSILHADPIAYDRISIPVEGQWKKTEKESYAMFEAPGKGGIVILASAAPGLSGDVYLERLMKQHTEGRTLLSISPQKIASGKTASGVPFSAQAKVTKGATDTWYVMYYVFSVEDRLQAVFVVAENAAAFKVLAKEVAPAFEKISIVAKIEPAKPAEGQPATSIFQQTGPMSDQFVSGVVTAQSAELKPVPFSIQGAMRFSVMSADDYDLVMSARDKDGSMYVTESSLGVFGSTDRAQFIHRIKNFGAPEKLSWSRRAVQSMIAQLSKEKIDMFFAESSSVHTLRVDEAGNLFIGANVDHDNAFIAISKEGTSTLLASMSQLSKVANGYQTGGTASRLYVSPKGTAWLMVQGIDKPGGKDYGTNAFYMRRTEEGGWRATPVPVRCGGQPCSMKVKYSIFSHGVVDEGGGFVFHDGNGFWRATPDGDVKNLLQLKLPGGDVRIVGPVLLSNGDIWYALSTVYNVSSYSKVDQQTGYAEVRNTWFTVGDRSRFIRIRVRGGKAELGEISSEAMFAALRKKGVPLRPDSQVMKTVRFVPDYATGGFIAFDAHHSVLYSILPGD